MKNDSWEDFMNDWFLRNTCTSGMWPPSFEHVAETVVIFRNFYETIDSLPSGFEISKFDSAFYLIAQLVESRFTPSVQIASKAIPESHNIVDVLWETQANINHGFSEDALRFKRT